MQVSILVNLRHKEGPLLGLQELLDVCAATNCGGSACDVRLIIDDDVQKWQDVWDEIVAVKPAPQVKASICF